MIFLLLEGVTDGVIGGYFTIFYGTLELLKRVQKTPRSLYSRGFCCAWVHTKVHVVWYEHPSNDLLINLLAWHGRTTLRFVGLWYTLI